MGSFNTTCFVSNQTIAPNDKCRIIAIHLESSFNEVTLDFKAIPEKRRPNLDIEKRFGFANSSCYPNCYWDPMSLFMEASYDDYGRFELVAI